MSAAKLLLCVTIVYLLVLSTDCAPPADAAAKVRQTRGFRNSALATARGFGKRNFSRDLSPTLNSAMADSAAISTSWLSDQMNKNPELAQLIVERFVDSDVYGNSNETKDNTTLCLLALKSGLNKNRTAMVS